MLVQELFPVLYNPQSIFPKDLLTQDSVFRGAQGAAWEGAHQLQPSTEKMVFTGSIVEASLKIQHKGYIQVIYNIIL